MNRLIVMNAGRSLCLVSSFGRSLSFSQLRLCTNSSWIVINNNSELSVCLDIVGGSV